MDATLNFLRYADENSHPYRAQLVEMLTPLFLPQTGRIQTLGPSNVEDWLRHTNLGAPNEPTLGTYFGVNAKRKVVVTGTLLIDDGCLCDILAIKADRLWRCVLTHPDYRRLGYGLSLCTHMDNQIQAVINNIQAPQTHSLFTDSYPAISIYESLRFVHERDLRIGIGIPGVNAPEASDVPIIKRLYMKTYSPPSTKD